MDPWLSLYSVTFLIGTVGNGVLVVIVSLDQGIRNPLKLGTITADFFVCSLSGPATAVLHGIPPNSTDDDDYSWLLATEYMQFFPLTASKFTLMALSMDRYLTLKNYRPVARTGSRRRRVLWATEAAAWIASAVLSCCEVTELQSIFKPPWKRLFTFGRLLIIVVIPCVVIMCTLFRVERTLSALSLLARARQGELPLPIPLIRRPTNVIIVAGMPQGSEQRRTRSDQDSTTESERQASDNLLQRRRLAYGLVFTYFAIIICWVPYIVVEMCEEFQIEVSETVSRLAFFMAQMYSVYGPFVHMFTSRNRTVFCRKLRKLIFFRSSSSTNEAALGPFNPRFIRPPPYRRPSFHYLF